MSPPPLYHEVSFTHVFDALSCDFRCSKTGWYRQGYQLDFPEEEEEIKERDVVVENGKKKTSRLQKHSVSSSYSSSSQSSPRDPIADSDLGSAGGDSYDQEGYVTSMHRDSGLTAPFSMEKEKRIAEIRRGRSFSTHSSSSTVAAGDPNGIRAGSSDSGAEDLQSPLTDEMAISKLDYASIPPVVAFPPLCEVSVSPSESSEPPSPAFFRSPLRATLPLPAHSTNPTRPRPEKKRPIVIPIPPQSAKQITTTTPPSDTADNPLDTWLLQKFQAEQNLRRPTTQKVISKQTRVCASEMTDLDPTSSLPRKTVRFCQ